MVATMSQGLRDVIRAWKNVWGIEAGTMETGSDLWAKDWIDHFRRELDGVRSSQAVIDDFCAYVRDDFPAYAQANPSVSVCDREDRAENRLGMFLNELIQRAPESTLQIDTRAFRAWRPAKNSLWLDWLGYQNQDKLIEVQGDVCSIAAYAISGEVHVHGNVHGGGVAEGNLGAHVVIDGDATGFIAYGMNGGSARVKGNSGFLGVPSVALKLRGGEVRIDGQLRGFGHFREMSGGVCDVGELLHGDMHNAGGMTGGVVYIQRGGITVDSTFKGGEIYAANKLVAKDGKILTS